jgi:hypothetical protein
MTNRELGTKNIIPKVGTTFERLGTKIGTRGTEICEGTIKTNMRENSAINHQNGYTTASVKEQLPNFSKQNIEHISTFAI